MKLRSSQLIVNENGGIIMGAGRMAILDSIEKTGSINKTAKELKMAYKTVWSKIRSTEENFGTPVVIADKKSGTELTKEGRLLLSIYRKLKNQCIKADDEIFKKLSEELKTI